jgi:hypothetical protein
MIFSQKGEAIGVFYFKKLPPYTPAGFVLTTQNSEGGDETTRPLRKGIAVFVFKRMHVYAKN